MIGQLRSVAAREVSVAQRRAATVRRRHEERRRPPAAASWRRLRVVAERHVYPRVPRLKVNLVVNRLLFESGDQFYNN